MNKYFDEMKGNFGFGCMRLKMNGDEVDYANFEKMIDDFMAAGFNYFDTAHGYIGEKSETAIRDCLVKRYPRESFLLTDKLTDVYFDSEEDILSFFEKQLEWTGVDYFDYYLLHAMSARIYKKFDECNAFEILKKLKADGKIKHIGMSFHDTAAVLDGILAKHPEIEVVQIQFNYLDYDDPCVQSKAVYDVCRKYNKPVIIMEPVKGGRLVNIPDEARGYFDALGGIYAEYALRFAAGFDGVVMVLSGMNDVSQMNENIRFMKDFKHITDEENAAIEKVRAVIRKKNLIACTACRYCVDGCPKNIDIPSLFSCLNDRMENKPFDYIKAAGGGGKASECVKCGKCESICPQQLKIRDLLGRVSVAFE